MSPARLRTLGWFATATAILMYASFIDQIRLNLTGQPGSILLPAAAVLNCTLWTAYGFFRPQRDWPIVMANLPGVVLGLLTVATAL